MDDEIERFVLRIADPVRLSGDARVLRAVFEHRQLRRRGGREGGG